MKKENVIKEKNYAAFKRKNVVFFDQSKMKATVTENSLNKYMYQESFQSVGPFDKIVVPSTALLYPAYKNNDQMRDGLRRGCATAMYCFIGHVKFPKLQTGIFVEWKAPLVFS